jgi:hypothetical protein
VFLELLFIIEGTGKCCHLKRQRKEKLLSLPWHSHKRLHIPLQAAAPLLHQEEVTEVPVSRRRKRRCRGWRERRWTEGSQDLSYGKMRETSACF